MLAFLQYFLNKIKAPFQGYSLTSYLIQNLRRELSRVYVLANSRELKKSVNRLAKSAVLQIGGFSPAKSIEHKSVFAGYAFMQLESPRLPALKLNFDLILYTIVHSSATLSAIELRTNGPILTEENAKEIANVRFECLESLEITVPDRNIAPAFIKALLVAAPNLGSLSLGNTLLFNNSDALVTEICKLQRLYTLRLDNTDITGAQLITLINNLPRLENLSIKGCPLLRDVTERQMLNLRVMPRLKNCYIHESDLPNFALAMMIERSRTLQYTHRSLIRLATEGEYHGYMGYMYKLLIEDPCPGAQYRENEQTCHPFDWYDLVRLSTSAIPIFNKYDLIMSAKKHKVGFHSRYCGCEDYNPRAKCEQDQTHIDAIISYVNNYKQVQGAAIEFRNLKPEFTEVLLRNTLTFMYADIAGQPVRAHDQEITNILNTPIPSAKPQ